MKLLDYPLKDRFSVVREKFNSILQHALLQTKAGYILDAGADAVLRRRLYDINNNLTHDGRVLYWRRVNIQIREFDLQKVTLLPEGNDQGPPRRPPLRRKTRKFHILQPQDLKDTTQITIYNILHVSQIIISNIPHKPPRTGADTT